MDIKRDIDSNLWEALEKNYGNEAYSSAILDAMFLLTEIIRNKTGLEGDGTNLVGQAFGGENPKIQLNKLQTESEKDIQKGVMEILKGLYTAIRNPRSHGKLTDNQSEADSIIIFINYLLSLIDKSKLAFEEDAFLKRIFDEHYVQSVDYSLLLVEEVPKRQRANVAINIILKRQKGDITSLSFFVRSLFKTLEVADIKQIYKVVSDELKLAESHTAITTMLHILPAKYWKNIDKAVRIRIENILLKDASEGQIDVDTNKCIYGAMATWIMSEHFNEFEDINKWINMMVKKLNSSNISEIEYVNKYLWKDLSKFNYEQVSFGLDFYIRDGLTNNDEGIIKKVTDIIKYEEKHPWWEIFKDELKLHPEILYEEIVW